MSNESTGEIILYHQDDGSTEIKVRLEDETVWLSQQQIAELFGVARTTIVEHIGHVYDDGELDQSATCRKFRQVRTEGTRKVARDIPLYNLDLILSVGYRVKSATATRFRIWATDRLRDYLVKGYAVNQQRLDQIGQVVRILGRATDELVSGSVDILAMYLPGLELLRDYDEGRIVSSPQAVPDWTLTIDEARAIIAKLRQAFPKDDLLGNEREDKLQAVVGAIYQSFAGQDLYPTVEEKAANLLYLTVKDHPLSDGNKRSAAALFITFLEKNGTLNDAAGNPRITSNALATLTLMVSMSDPKEKDIMIALLTHMIDQNTNHIEE
ncbi:virulence protein RhuM/Fic/DOC family protein [Bifidobacterium crudilactis]|jgi:prophage maintenance system killer protein|uniref:Virulence protein RhuM/Fic/DOC family protein n=2 Tax=Bifidobacterium crudilactis TaxID=327277 RepID=A0A971IDV3_9BIFI|nr:virulence protein RhuM/Fic/DOC family protein [Bifidobacterium crudilactis]MCI1867710.1 virulence protein RhuM/Fic/DOC family protein [Bifidobacterium crudilactis]MDN5973267.1 virulence protein RhuM/Fic/DOC family protein [Bifidobacterium crudilactis]MDN6001708.1 virulence protein RhuM/Fic/DOC family protein [Bifidobacterium crudilactis]MDN6210289.1 virulence protein RhuM/Fic/DOC family protein [Bifidobacterium crudilactis]MDN6467927.1 virulence protein RhuM/Fic/DOC family protein [Bifidoba